ncbi:MAG: hypothetical protein HYX59_08440 [Elusimicrobia bacterium]|nr:hypothetical protein [Elusimicrobiota bacterium]
MRIGTDGTIQWTYSSGQFLGGINQIAAFPDGTVFATSVQGYFFPYPPGTMRASLVRLDSSGPASPPPSVSLSGDGEPLPFPNPIIGVTPGGVAVDPLNDRVYTIHQRLIIYPLLGAAAADAQLNAYDRSLSLLTQRAHSFEFPDSFIQLAGVFVDSSSFVWVAGVEYPPSPLPRRLFVERHPPNLSGPPIIYRLTLDATFGGAIRAALDPRGGLVVGGERSGGNSDYFRRVSSEGFSASFREPGFAGGPMAVDAEGSLYIAGHEPIGGLPALVKVSSSDTQAWGASFVTLASDRRIEALWSPSTGTIDVGGTVDVSFPGSDQTFISRYRRGAGASGRLVAVSDLVQASEVDAELASPLIVEARDAAGAPQGNVIVNFSISSAPVGAVGQQLVSTDLQTNSFTGRAKTGFKVGNIPLEYEVKADCPSCGATSSSVTFQICGQLPATLLHQNGETWSNDVLDNHSRGWTLGVRGCALTAYTMLLNVFKSRFQYTYPVSTPGTLNSFLTDPDTYGFVPDANLDFDLASEQFTQDQVRFAGRFDVDTSPARYSASARGVMRRVDSSLAAGNPALVQVESTSLAGHFLTVIGRCGNLYLVKDPYAGLDYQSISIDDPNSPIILGARIFRRGE